MTKFSPYEQVVSFHGHSCPGLAMGYRLTLAALETLNISRAEDEEIVTIVENDACGTDAVQFISGCTFGKGNFHFKDLGKMAYNFYNRKTGRSIRVIRKNSFRDRLDGLKLDRNEKIIYILECSVEEIVDFKTVEFGIPPKALLFNNVICDSCGESVMESRITIENDNKFCLSCLNKRSVNG